MMIKRKIEKVIKNQLNKNEITVVTGARQVGKTTSIKRIMGDLKKKGEHIVFFNLDIEADARFFTSQELLLDKIRLELGDKSGFIFIDEIQRKENAGKFLKGLYDMDLPYKFVVTGSGSLQLKENISESLAGRKRLIEMHTVTFEEFVDYKTEYKYADRLELFYKTSLEQMNSLLMEYLGFGGYPKIVTENDRNEKVEIINEIFSSYIARDITYLLGIRSPDKFILFIQLLAAQSGSIIQYAQLASDINISVETLKKYIWYAEHTFIIKKVLPFFTNSKKELTKSPTIYFNDLGMNNFARSQFGKSFENSGYIFQNFVFLLISSNFHKITDKVCFWRSKDKAEVDFVVKKDNELIPVEVKFSQLKKASISRSYRNFIGLYQPEQGFLVNLSLEEEIVIGNTKVSVVPYWKLI